jgi:hypothetical protein
MPSSATALRKRNESTYYCSVTASKALFHLPQQHAHLFTLDGKRLIDISFIRALNNPEIYLQRSASLGLACLYTV